MIRLQALLPRPICPMVRKLSAGTCVRGSFLAHECCDFGCLHVHGHSNVNRVRRCDGRMPQSAQIVLVLQSVWAATVPLTCVHCSL